MKEKLDLRFLGYSLGALALLSAGWFGVHAFQMTRHGSTLLDLASQAEAQWKPDGGKLEREKFDRALRFLGQYVKLVPTDIDARVRYGELFEKKDKLPATKVNAMAVYEQVLLRDPERVEIRRRIAKLAVDVKDFALAHTHLEGLEEDAEIKSLLAQCFAAEKDYTKAAKYFEESIDGDPHRVENYVLLAEILRVRLDQRDEADNTMKELLVKNNPTSSKAYLERAKYQQRYPQASDAQGAKSATGIAKAPRQVPEEVVRQLATAEIARDKGDLAGARDVLQHAVKLHPKEVPLYQAEASLELAAKRPKEALESLRRGLREVEVPNRPDLIFGLAQLLIQQGEDKEAQAAIKQLRDLKLLVEADIAEARRLAPKEVASLLELETAAKMEGDLAGARDLRQQARTLEAPPLLATVEIARDKGDLAGARDVLQQALALDPKNVKLYQAGADLESAANRPEKALESLQRGLEKLSEQPDLIFGQALLKIQLGWDEDDVKKTIKQLRGLKLPFFYADYLNALLKFRERDWDAASAKLENIRPLLVEVPELAAPADGLLVQCYEQLGNVEGQLSVYRRVGSADPFNITARLGTVSTLFKLGRIEEAIEENQRLLQLPSAPASAWTSLARLRFLQTSRLGTPNWESVEQTLDQVAQKVPEAVDVPILKAEIRAARGEPDEARQDLETALKKQPKRIELWVAVVDHEDHEKKWLQAQKTLERAEQELGDGVDLRLAKARHLFRRGGEVTDPAFQKLTASLDTLDAKDQARLLKGLVEICVQFNHADEALRLGSQLTEPDLRARLFLFDAALQAGDEAQMEEQLAAILGIEGVQGPFWNVCEASYLIWKFKNERPKDPDEARAYLVAARAYLVKARACLSAAAKRRPAWGRIYLKLGEIDELESKEDQDPAIRNYMRAIELGEQEFAFISHLLQLLYKDQRYNDAELVIAKLPSQTPVSAELQGMILEISRQTQDYTLALDAARKAVAKDSKNYRDFIWLGQILLGQIRWIGHQKEEAKQVLKEEALKKEAEHVLRRAVQLAENEPDPWVALVQFLASTNKVEAEETLLQAEGKLDQKKYVLAFAECYEAVGRLGKAGELFDAAVNAEPTNFAVLRGAANYHLRQANYHLRQGYLKKAKNELNRIISLENESPQKTAWAKRVLAVVLAQGDYQERQHALAILDGGPQPDKVEDVRARALVLAAQPSRDHKKKACELLEDLNRSQPLSS
jgi:tetratricopeptide (TPR) repeat protein